MSYYTRTSFPHSLIQFDREISSGAIWLLYADERDVKVVENCTRSPMFLFLHMVTVTPFNANLEVHIRQFYVNENGEIKASRIGITLSVEEFNELVKLIPKIQDSITQCKLQNIGPSPPPLIDLENTV